MIPIPAKAWLVLAIALSISTALGVAWVKGKNYCENKVAKAVLIAEQDAAVKRDVLTLNHMRTMDALNEKNRKIREELRNAITDIPACYYTPEQRLLLDAARGVSEAASLDAGTDAGANTHTSRQAATDQWADDSKQWEQCRERVNQFIEWHQ